MLSGRRERRSGSDNDDGDSGSWTFVPQQDEMLAGRGVVDTKRTMLSSDNRPALDEDVETDAVSCTADERIRQSSNLTGHRLSPSSRTKDDSLSGLQETLTTTGSVYYMETGGGVGETVQLTSRSATSKWNNTVVLPVDDHGTSNAFQLSSSPQAEMSGGHSAVSGLVRENGRLREINKQQAEKIYQLTTELSRAYNLPRSPEESSMDMQLLKEQMAVYKEDFNNERRDKERALSEKDSLMKQTTTLLNDLKAVQERNLQLEAALQIARQNASSNDEERRRVEFRDSLG